MFILELSKRRNGWVNLKGKDIVAIFFALIISFGAVYLTNRPIADKDPIPCYRVYLEGKSLGLITSKDELNDYINKQQEKLKEQYKVDTVFIPNDIDVVKDVTYDNNFSTIEEIYNKINEVSPFTIKGYVSAFTKLLIVDNKRRWFHGKSINWWWVDKVSFTEEL